MIEPVAGNTPRSLRYGNLNLRLIDAGRQVTITADGIYGANWAHDASICAVDGVRGRAELLPGGVRFTRLFAAADGGNPPRLTAVINELKPVLVVKAWGLICLNNGTVVQPAANAPGTDGAGGWDLLLTATRVVITWQFQWADLSYSVVVKGCRYGNVPGLNVEEDLSQRTKNSSSFIINQNFDQLGIAVDPRSIITAFTFQACGRQAS